LIRILLVDDDNARIRANLRAVLEQVAEWVVVGEAANGRKAVETWRESAPDVTVMDFLMPEMNGLEAARRLSKRYPEAPILMVTTDPSRQLGEEAKRAGIRGLCAKCDVRSLLKAVEALLRGQTYFHWDFAAA
jgi:DNA-binding NarL/FixJ family response regulator